MRLFWNIFSLVAFICCVCHLKAARQSSNQWTGTITKKKTCAGTKCVEVVTIICGDPGSVTNGHRTDIRSSDGKFHDGDQIVYSCNPGYYAVGPVTVTCENDANWSDIPPFCIEKTFRGKTTQQGRFRGKTQVIECKSVPNEVPDCTSKVTATGSSTSTIPLPVSLCDDPGIPENGIYTGIPVKGFTPGSQVEFQCKFGFVLRGSAIIVCNKNGKWSDIIPSCMRKQFQVRPTTTTRPTTPVPKIPATTRRIPAPLPNKKMCSDPGLVKNSKREISVKSEDWLPDGTTVTYKCLEGFKIQGPSVITCTNGRWSSKLPQCFVECGEPIAMPSITALIFGGQKVDEGQWPWMAAIIWDKAGTSGNVVCGGSLIGKGWVLTAAHCVVQRRRGIQYTRDALPPEEISIGLGKYYRSKDIRGITQVKKAAFIRVHELFEHKPTGLVSDIALIRLDSNVALTQWVRPICLPNVRDSDERGSLREDGRVEGTVIGWGLNDDDNEAPLEELQGAKLPLQPPSFCNQPPVQMDHAMFCTGQVAEKTVAICSGDSGGPWMRRKKRWIVEGVVSFKAGDDCGSSTFLSVFTRVDRFIDWIVENTNSHQVDD